MNSEPTMMPEGKIEQSIILIRNEKVMLDADLARLYGVETKALTRAVRRNIERFPSDFMFQLTKQEFDDLRSHFGTSSQWGGRRYPPYAFTELGVAMLSSVLRSQRAIGVNIEIMRTFIRMRRMLEDNKALWNKIEQLEKKYDRQFKIVFDALRELMAPPPQKKRPIGFMRENE